MASVYDFSAEAQNDLFDIWRRIAGDSVELANRIESEFYELFASLGRMPGQGHTRKDLTPRPCCSSRCTRSWWSISRM
jgi:plasmid stabilization system protein ParE